MFRTTSHENVDRLPVHRIKILIGAGLLILGGITTFGEHEQALETNVWVSPSKARPKSFVRAFQHDLNKDPIFRAASVNIFSAHSGGTASLVTVDKKLFLRTPEHVVGGLHSRYAYVYFPGLAKYARVAVADFENRRPTNPTPTVHEKDMTLPLRGKVAERLGKAVARRTITPLTLATNTPTRGEAAIANSLTGEFVHRSYETNELMAVGGEYYRAGTTTQDLNYLFCPGNSGQPLLSVNSNGTILPEAVGILLGASAEVAMPNASSIQCGVLGLFKPN